jgi:hypothetical protein
MTTIIAALEFKDYAVLTAILVIFAAVTTFVRIFFAGRAGNAKRSYEDAKLMGQMHEIQRKQDALLKQQGIEMPPPASGLSPGVEQLAKDPKTKLAAIKLYLEENPGTSLREANERIVAFYESKK